MPARLRRRAGATLAAVAVAVAAGAGAAVTGCGAASDGGGPGSGLVFDPCAPLSLLLDPAAPAPRAGAVATGAALWNDRAFTRLAVDSSGAANLTGGAQVVLSFQRAAVASHGLYDPAIATIFLNVDLDGDAHALAVTVAHEVGHALGLPHVAPSRRPSVMNPGNLRVEPTSEDAAALEALWGPCSPPAPPEGTPP